MALSNNEALSLLNRMDTEENTLRGLWDQFTVARRQAREVIARFEEALVALPGLEDRKDKLEAEILDLERDMPAHKESIRKEISDYRASLEAELVDLEKQVSAGREKVIAINGSVREAESRYDDRKSYLAGEIQAAEARLVAAEQAYKDLAKRFSGVNS